MLFVHFRSLLFRCFKKHNSKYFTEKDAKFMPCLLRNEFDFWNVHGIMNTSVLLKSKFSLTFQET